MCGIWSSTCRRTTIRMSRTSDLRQPLEAAMSQESLAGYVAILDVCDKLRVHPRSLRLPHLCRQPLLRGRCGIQAPSQVGRHRRAEAGPALADVAQLLALALAQVERRDAARLGDEADDREAVADAGLDL